MGLEGSEVVVLVFTAEAVVLVLWGKRPYFWSGGGGGGGSIFGLVGEETVVWSWKNGAYKKFWQHFYGVKEKFMNCK